MGAQCWAAAEARAAGAPGAGAGVKLKGGWGWRGRGEGGWGGAGGRILGSSRPSSVARQSVVRGGATISTEHPGGGLCSCLG